MTSEFQRELFHHGILGQKWGVRRFQNYDGSYTQAGMKRYNKSLDTYNHANERYKKAKANYKANKNNPDSNVSTELTNARLARKQAKRRLDKDYKHLKQDKLADQGKNIYSKGKTINGSAAVTNALYAIGTSTLSAAAFGYSNKIIDKKVAQILVAGGLGTFTLSSVKALTDNYNAKRLRAYYGHTSNY